MVNEGAYAVSIGYRAGQSNLGNYAIAIGYLAGRQTQHANSICIDATNQDWAYANRTLTEGLFIRPVRNVVGANLLYYNASNYEFTYASKYVLNAILTSNKSLTNATSVLIDTFVDGGGSTDFTDMASGAWTCHETGHYKISFDAQGQSSNGTATSLFADILIGTTVKKQVGTTFAPGSEDYGQFIVSANTILSLTANDVLTIKVRADFASGTCHLRGDSTTTFTNLIIEKLI